MMNAGHVGGKPFTCWQSPQRRSPKVIFFCWEILTCAALPLQCFLLPAQHAHAEQSPFVEPPGLMYGTAIMFTLTYTAKSFSGSKTLI